MRLALVLLVLMLAPVAMAESLHDFEQLHPPAEAPPRDGDQSWPLSIDPADIGRAHALIFRGQNTPNKLTTFSVIVCDSEGREVWWKNGTRSIDAFPEIVPPAIASPRSIDCNKHATSDTGDSRTLAPGSYTILLRGRGAFQVTDKFLERGGNMSVNGTLYGPAAWALTPTRAYFVDVTGNGVSVEQSDLGQNVHLWSTPASLLVEANQSYVFTVRGWAGASYSMTLRPAGDGAGARTPGAGLFGIAVVGSLAALSLRRRT